MLIALIVLIGYTTGKGQEEYDANKDVIMSEINSLIESKEYDAAITLIRSNQSYDTVLYELANKTEETQLTDQLRSIPVSEHQKNLSLYKKLAIIRPKNQTYKEKVEFYSTKVNQASAERDKRAKQDKAERDRELAATEKKRREDILNPPWRLLRSKDEMTNEESIYIRSSSFSSISPMEFPYQSVTSWIGIGCKKDSRWVYIGFSESPNLSNTQTEDGYNTFRTKVRFDDVVETLSFTQKWAADFIYPKNDEQFIRKLSASKNVRLALEWYGQREVYFDYQMHQFDKVLGEMKSDCAIL